MTVLEPTPPPIELLFFGLVSYDIEPFVKAPLVGSGSSSRSVRGWGLDKTGGRLAW
jgi:hypothetical protein